MLCYSMLCERVFFYDFFDWDGVLKFKFFYKGLRYVFVVVVVIFFCVCVFVCVCLQAHLNSRWNFAWNIIDYGESADLIKYYGEQ